MVENPLQPLPAHVAVRAVGQDGSVFQGDVDLVIEAIGDPALDLLAAGASGVHGLVEGMVDVVVGALGAQGGFEFCRGHRGLGHWGTPGSAAVSGLASSRASPLPQGSGLNTFF
ncbi:hypothetical protein D3C86_1661460 [compost metagenome]